MGGGGRRVAHGQEVQGQVTHWLVPETCFHWVSNNPSESAGSPGAPSSRCSCSWAEGSARPGCSLPRLAQRSRCPGSAVLRLLERNLALADRRLRPPCSVAFAQARCPFPSPLLLLKPGEQGWALPSSCLTTHPNVAGTSFQESDGFLGLR
ncbi:hypothetical protein GHT09_013956 [Marmota monax]|uniref:Uncharacterized protein n=1 Tax=Marmota monax TaxID=9995 RepID=A0A834QDP7_MARMO|nr:hypothetical protein GHT09_013956 [Marmota monax]